MRRKPGTSPSGLSRWISWQSTIIDVFVRDADPTTTTDPLDEDSDDDGLLDGEEDLNGNGRVDDGETDPNRRQVKALPFIPMLLLSD